MENSSPLPLQGLAPKLLPPNPQRKGEGGLRYKACIKLSNNDKAVKVHPLITVITVVFNGVKTLEQTILSVINQSYENVEFIIIDGGSTDSTLDIIQKYEDAIDYWVSEADKGIYDAMNKGIVLANGQWINFMNAGDSFVNLGILDNIKFKCAETVVLVGNIKYESGRIFYSLSHSMTLKNAIHHQGAFYSRKLFDKLGLYSTNYKVLSDYHFNFKCLKNGFILLPLNLTVALCSNGGVSDTPKWINYREEIEIRREFVSSVLSRVMFGVYSIGRCLIKRFLRWI